jgi:hypothetical protein
MELRLPSSKQETHISETDSRLAGEKFPAFEGPTCFFPCHNSLSLDHVLRQLNLISNYLHTVSLYSILPSTLSSRKWHIFQVFLLKCCMHFSSPHVWHMSCLSHLLYLNTIIFLVVYRL